MCKRRWCWRRLVPSIWNHRDALGGLARKWKNQASRKSRKPAQRPRVARTPAGRDSARRRSGGGASPRPRHLPRHLCGRWWSRTSPSGFTQGGWPGPATAAIGWPRWGTSSCWKSEPHLSPLAQASTTELLMLNEQGFLKTEEQLGTRYNKAQRGLPGYQCVDP